MLAPSAAKDADDDDGDDDDDDGGDDGHDQVHVREEVADRALNVVRAAGRRAVAGDLSGGGQGACKM